MIVPFVELLVMRWSRRSGGRAAALLALLVPLGIAGAHTLAWGRPGPEGALMLGLGSSILLAGPATACLVAAAVDDERRTGSARLLRVGSIDGARAVGGLAAFGLLAALLTALLCHVAPVLLGAASAAAYLRSVVVVWLAVSACLPAVILLALLVPAPGVFVAEALVAAAGGAMLAGSFLEDPASGSIAGLAAASVAANVAGLPLVGWIWRLASSRLWA